MRNFIFLISFSLLTIPVQGQIQIGLDVETVLHSYLGTSVHMPNATTFAAGGRIHDDGGMTDVGIAQVYTLDANDNWVQKGQDLVGDVERCEFGRSVYMPNENTVAVGTGGYHISLKPIGYVRVFTWNGNQWVQMGNDIMGLEDNDYTGWNIAMPDSVTVAISSHTNSNQTGFQAAGIVRVFTWNGTSWTQKGSTLKGNSNGAFFGLSMDMSDPDHLAVGSRTGVFTYEWDGFTWAQTASMSTEAQSISMPNQNTLAVGYSEAIPNNAGRGKVQVYTWQNNSWLPKGPQLNGDSLRDAFGSSVYMPNSDMIAVGATQPQIGSGPQTPPADVGYARVYRWNGSSWNLKANTVMGTDQGGLFGYSISMADTNTFAVGAPEYQKSNLGGGLVQVYSFDTTSTNNTSLSENEGSGVLKVFPNPSSGTYFVELEGDIQPIRLNLYSSSGQLVKSRNVEGNRSNLVTLEIETEAGFYILEVIDERGDRSELKLLKQ